MQFGFQKHRSDTWDPKMMFSAPSGRSAQWDVTDVTKQILISNLYRKIVGGFVLNRHGNREYLTCLYALALCLQQCSPMTSPQQKSLILTLVGMQSFFAHIPRFYDQGRDF